MVHTAKGSGSPKVELSTDLPQSLVSRLTEDIPLVESVRGDNYHDYMSAARSCSCLCMTYSSREGSAALRINQLENSSPGTFGTYAGRSESIFAVSTLLRLEQNLHLRSK